MDGTHEERVVKDFITQQAIHEQTKANYNAARDALLALFPKNPGVSNSKKIAGFNVTIGYPEKLKWDTAALNAYYGADFPAHVKQSLSIDLRAFKRMPQADQDALQTSYETVCGTAEIDVVT